MPGRYRCRGERPPRLDVDGTSLRRLSNTDAAEANPSWARDGALIAFEFQVAGRRSELAVVEPDGVEEQLTGGKSDVALSLAMRGRSPHQWASTASGNFRLVVGPATLVNTKGRLDTSIERLLDAVNPLRVSDPSTDLVCAVIRLPLANGVALACVESRKPGDFAALNAIRNDLGMFIKRRRAETLYYEWQEYLLKEAGFEDRAQLRRVEQAFDRAVQHQSGRRQRGQDARVALQGPRRPRRAPGPERQHLR